MLMNVDSSMYWQEGRGGLDPRFPNCWDILLEPLVSIKETHMKCHFIYLFFKFRYRKWWCDIFQAQIIFLNMPMYEKEEGKPP